MSGYGGNRMKWYPLPLGPLQTNCYVLAKEDRTCLIFDPGEEGKKLIDWISKMKLIPKAIFLTHAHFDHIGAVDAVREQYSIPVYLHKKEKDWLRDPVLNGSQSFLIGNPMKISPADILLSGEEELSVEGFQFKVIETPGHSPGSVSYYFAEDDLIVSGDVLFQGGIGRTDLRGGNHDQLIKNIHEKLLTLPENTLVLCGHGPQTLIGDEMDSNPFLNGF